MVKRTQYDYINRTRVHRGENPTQLLDGMYRYRDHVYSPHNQNPKPRNDPAENKEAARQDGVRPHQRDDVFNLNVSQHPANFHDTNYDNDSGGWVRGCRSGEPTCDNEDATVKPFFDHSANRPSMQRNGGNEWPRSPSDKPSSRQHGDRRHGTEQTRFQGGLAAEPGEMSTRTKPAKRWD